MLLLIALAVLAFVLLLLLRLRLSRGDGNVLVVVLGDAGRSPRMQYHCISLLKAGYSVDLVAHGGSELVCELYASECFQHHQLVKCPEFAGFSLLVIYVVKVVFQTCNLLWVFMKKIKKPSHILLQTPPSIPTLILCVVVSSLWGSKLIVDYHNYGHTILALSLGYAHPLVKMAKMYEEIVGKFADSNICVTKAMKRDLDSRLSISATVFYDRPPKRFKTAEVDVKHKLFLKLGFHQQAFRSVSAVEKDIDEERTAFTEVVHGKVRMRMDRPFLLVSSTSWTKDEDFGVLLEALKEYDEVSTDAMKLLPKIVCVITGKGPLKDMYVRTIKSMDFNCVKICTLWLSAEDYPVLLGSADLGVCLHKSTSGLDLPMKVVDMFGSGLPVCALNFNCLDELVIHDYNGMVFSSSLELTNQIQDLCCGFPQNTHKLKLYRDNLLVYQTLRWEHYWRIHVLPLITKL